MKFLFPIILITLLFSNPSFACQNEKAIEYKTKADALYRSKPDSAIHFFNLALPLVLENQCWEEYVECNMGMAASNYYLGNYSEMRPFLETAEEFNEKYLEGDLKKKGAILSLFSVLYNTYGNNERSIETGLKALEIQLNQEKIDSSALATSYVNLGAFYKAKKDIDKSLDYLFKAMEIMPEKKIINKISAYNGLGIAYNQLNQFAKGLEYLEKGRVLAEGPPKKPRLLYKTYNNIGRSYLGLDDYENAQLFFEKALAVTLEKNYNPRNVYLNLGVTAKEQNHFEEALTYYQSALQALLNRKKKNDADIGLLYKSLGEVYTNLNELDSALFYAQKSLISLVPEFSDSDWEKNPTKEMGNRAPQFLLYTLKAKSKALFKSYDQDPNENKLKVALDCQELVIDLIQKMRNGYASEKMLEFFAEDVHGAVEVAIEAALKLYEATEEEQYLNRAFQFAEYNKGLTLLESLNDEKAKMSANIPPYLLAQEGDLKSEIAYYQNQLVKAQQKKNDAKIQEVQSILFKQKSKLEALITQLENQYPAYYASKNITGLPTLSSVQSELNSDELFIEYFVGDSSIYTFAIDQNGTSYWSMPRTDEIEKTIADYYSFLSNASAFSNQNKLDLKSYNDVAYGLFETLLKPVFDQKNGIGKRLIIATDGILNNVPFEAFLTKNLLSLEGVNFSNFDYLVHSNTINYTYSAAFSLNVSNSKRTNQQCLAFAPSYSNQPQIAQGRLISLRGEMGDLPATQTEAKSISQFFKGNYYFGDLATKENFQKEAPDYGILHLAMHGKTDMKNPLNSSLAFGNDAKNHLYLYEIMNLDLNADLTVLSACETGTGQTLKGEGVKSIARSFLQAGSSSVVMSHWKVEDYASSNLMSHFYKNLSEGTRKDEALQKAKLAYLQDATGIQSHPFFWAGFVNFGNPEPLTSGGFPIWVWGVVGLLSMFLVWRLVRGK